MGGGQYGPAEICIKIFIAPACGRFGQTLVRYVSSFLAYRISIYKTSIVLVATCNISELPVSPVNLYISNSIIRVVTCNIHHLYITCQTCKIHAPVSPVNGC